MTPREILHQLKHLDRSSLQFPDQLASLLHTKGYKEAIPKLHDEEVVWLVKYLDDVCLRFARVSRRPLLNTTRFSTLLTLTLPALRSGNVSVNLGGSAVPGIGYRSRTYSKVRFRSPTNTQWPLEVLVMSTKAR